LNVGKGTIFFFDSCQRISFHFLNQSSSKPLPTGRKEETPKKTLKMEQKKKLIFLNFLGENLRPRKRGKKAFFQKTATTFRCSVCRGQGDQIGRIFAFWANFRLLGDNCLSALFFNYRSRQNVRTSLSHRKKFCTNFEPKTDWATLWAIFSPTHPVTLVVEPFYGTTRAIRQIRGCQMVYFLTKISILGNFGLS
jgi:hypothetical protein